MLMIARGYQTIKQQQKEAKIQDPSAVGTAVT